MLYPYEREMMMDLLDIPDLHGVRDECGKPMDEKLVLWRCAERVAIVHKWNAIRDDEFPGWRDEAIEKILTERKT